MRFKDTICIKDLKVDCVVGVHPDERYTPQPLLTDIEMTLDTEKAAITERLRATVDYTAVAAQVRFLLQSGRFRLLETAAHVLCQFLLMPPALGENRIQIEHIQIRLTKPSALPQRAFPVLTIQRHADGAIVRSRKTPFGRVDDICQTREARIYRLSLAPGVSIDRSHKRGRCRSEMVLTDGLICQAKRIPKGTIHKWSTDQPLTYQNPSNRYQSVLCIET